MKRLEDAVIPTIGAMMSDQPTVLDGAQQAAIARWAIKCSMVFEFINRTESIFYTDAEREGLRLSGAIPQRTFVEIARGLGVDYFFAWGNELTADVAQLKGLVTTIAYRRFVLQVVTVRTAQPRGTRLILDGQMDIWKDVPIRVWPTRGAATWANANTISSLDAMDAFHSRVGSAKIEAHASGDISTVFE